jgi:hypothetical protein
VLPDEVTASRRQFDGVFGIGIHNFEVLVISDSISKYRVG